MVPDSNGGIRGVLFLPLKREWRGFAVPWDSTLDLSLPLFKVAVTDLNSSFAVFSLGRLTRLNILPRCFFTDRH